jgi:hypothetical protein
MGVSRECLLLRALIVLLQCRLEISCICRMRSHFDARSLPPLGSARIAASLSNITHSQTRKLSLLFTRLLLLSVLFDIRSSSAKTISPLLDGKCPLRPSQSSHLFSRCVTLTVFSKASQLLALCPMRLRHSLSSTSLRHCGSTTNGIPWPLSSDLLTHSRLNSSDVVGPIASPRPPSYSSPSLPQAMTVSLPFSFNSTLSPFPPILSAHRNPALACVRSRT